MANSSQSTSAVARAGEHVGQAAEETRNTIQEKASEVASSVRDMGATAMHAAQEQYERVRDTASEYLDQGREKAQELTHTLESQIRRQPLKAALIAVGIGFVLGICFVRR